MGRRNILVYVCLTVAVVTLISRGDSSSLSAQRPAGGVPQYEFDASWPPALPNNWVWGVPTWVAVDRRDHVWVLHRPRNAPKEQLGRAAPAVVEFDPSGKFLQAWGGPGQGFDWPDTEHGIFVDHQDRVWITGINPRAGTNVSTRADDMLLKFSTVGKFLQQIGGRDVSGGNKDTKNPHQSAEVYVHPKTNEAFLADGYGNRRIWVLDADTGAHKRMWGAFGNAPLDPPPATPPVPGAKPPEPVNEGPGPDQFGIVHGAKVSNDGMVYVADRGNRRIQVFTLDGKYLKQGFVNRTTSGASCGTIVFSPDPQQQFIYCPDFAKGEIAIVNRQTLETVGAFGTRGANPGQFGSLHALAIDSKGTIYGAEVGANRRVQKFIYKGTK